MEDIKTITNELSVNRDNVSILNEKDSSRNGKKVITNELSDNRDNVNIINEKDSSRNGKKGTLQKRALSTKNITNKKTNSCDNSAKITKEKTIQRDTTNETVDNTYTNMSNDLDEFDISQEFLDNLTDFIVDTPILDDSDLAELFPDKNVVLDRTQSEKVAAPSIFDEFNFDINDSSEKPSFENLKSANTVGNEIGGDKYEENKFSNEKIEIIYENELVRVEKIYSLGEHTNEGMWYNQPITETVKVTRGEAIMTVGSKMLNLIAGDAIVVSAGEKHRVDFTSPDCEWLCVFFKI